MAVPVQPISYVLPAPSVANLQQTNTVIINYTYDALSRLTTADYDSGDYFHYTYDAVGNRLTQDTLAGTNTYTYDIANRLTSVDGVPYTLDLNMGLTQVLNDGTNAYLYGVGRISQHNLAPDTNSPEYFLGDALGSVRQLVDPAGVVTLSQSYAPYGDTLNSVGVSSSVYQFTGEAKDSYINHLTYLRARYLDSSTGRFTQRDPSGLEANLYLYAKANPITRLDPTGLFSKEQIASSMGVGNAPFETLMHALALTMPAPMLPDDDKWGFFSALLDAEDGDFLHVGSAILITSHPYIQSKGAYLLWQQDCDQIMVGSRPLRDFFDYVLLQPTVGELPAQYWRDTSPHYYVLQGSNKYGFYVDGSDKTDLPDFHSVDISISGGPFGFGVSYIVDRFGNNYISSDFNIDIPNILDLLKNIHNFKLGGGGSYSEGYVCPDGSYSSDCVYRTPSLNNGNPITRIIEGNCTSSGAIYGIGSRMVSCTSGSRGIIYSWGPTIGVGVGYGNAASISHNSSMGWNWAIEDRLNGVNYYELIMKSKTGD
ncbi:MAG: RHS repeat-associated core domain-containing protein [Anaerolineales bacterium]|nr:RHS repeat-associated core domain-containing protein [Anaerolineales bacterium]